MSGPIPFDELFDAKFLADVSRLRVIAKRVASGGRFAEQRSKTKGSGLEFQDYRPYSPGDEFRAIDWNLYRRLGKVFLRLFEELEDLPFYLFPDVSASTWFDDADGARSPRAIACLRTTLALASIGSNQHDPVGVFPFSNELATGLPMKAGKGRTYEVANYLASLSPGGTTDFKASFKRFAAMNKRQGLVCVVSDFFDPTGVEAVVDALRGLRHQLILVQLVRAGDRTPDLSGDLRLVDCEGGAFADVSVTRSVLDRYTAAYDAFHAELTEFCKRRGAGYVQLDVDQDLLGQLGVLFEGGRFVA